MRAACAAHGRGTGNRRRCSARRIPSPRRAVVRTFRRSTRPRRRRTYPGLRQPARRCRCKPTRSSLKMKRVDPARARVSAQHGVLMPAASRASAASAARSSLLPSMDQFFSVRSAIHLHGSTPHRKSGVVSGHRAERHTAEPIRANTTACLAIRDGMAGARKNGGDRCIGIGCRHASALAATRFRERPAMIAGRSQAAALRMTSTGP